MLKLKEPIKCTPRNITTCVATGLAERLSKNYTIMDSYIEGQDLLHACSNPSNVFLAEADNISIFNDNKNNINIMQNKLDIINQVVNRLIIAPDVKMTYQDRVYLTAMLNKLGIRNHQEFVNQVYKVIKESRERQKEIKFLKDSTDNLNKQDKRNIEAFREQITDKYLERINESSILKLQDVVFERLDMGNIYNEIVNKFMPQYKSEDITYQDTNLQEYNIASQYMQINKYTGNVLGERTPLTYYEENIYEKEEENLEDIDKTYISNKITKAILLNLVKNVYNSRIDSINSKRDEFYNITNGLYNSVDNTIKRYRENIEGNNVNIVSDSNIISNLTHAVLEYTNAVSTVENNENNISENGENYNSRIVNNQYNRNTVENRESGRVYNEYNRNTTENRENLYLKQENNNLKEQQIVEQLQKIEEKNIDNRNAMLRAIREMDRRKEEIPEKRKKSLKEKRQEALRAIENPQEFIHEYLREEKEKETNTRLERESFLELLNPETRQYLELIDRYINNPGPEEIKLRSVTDPMSLLMGDIYEANMTHINREEDNSREENTENNISITTDNYLKVNDVDNYIQNSREIRNIIREQNTEKENAVKAEVSGRNYGKELPVNENGDIIEDVLQVNENVKKTGTTILNEILDETNINSAVDLNQKKISESTIINTSSDILVNPVRDNYIRDIEEKEIRTGETANIVKRKNIINELLQEITRNSNVDIDQRKIIEERITNLNRELRLDEVSERTFEDIVEKVTRAGKTVNAVNRENVINELLQEITRATNTDIEQRKIIEERIANLNRELRLEHVPENSFTDIVEKVIRDVTALRQTDRDVTLNELVRETASTGNDITNTRRIREKEIVNTGRELRINSLRETTITKTEENNEKNTDSLKLINRNNDLQPEEYTADAKEPTGERQNLQEVTGQILNQVKNEKEINTIRESDKVILKESGIENLSNIVVDKVLQQAPVTVNKNNAGEAEALELVNRETAPYQESENPDKGEAAVQKNNTTEIADRVVRELVKETKTSFDRETEQESIKKQEMVNLVKEETVSILKEESAGEKKNIKLSRGEAEIVNNIIDKAAVKVENRLTGNITEATEISLTHKLQQTLDEEEIMEQLRQVKREVNSVRQESTTSTDTFSHIDNRETVTNVIRNEVNDVRLEEMVRNAVTGQIGDLSDRVYNKLERRLASEKMRYGR